MKMNKATCLIIQQANESSFRSSDDKGSKNSKRASPNIRALYKLLASALHTHLHHPFWIPIHQSKSRDYAQKQWGDGGRETDFTSLWKGPKCHLFADYHNFA